MTETAAIELAGAALSLAREAGAESAEAAVSIARRFHAEARENVVARLEGSTGKSLFLRVFRGGRKATLSTSDFSSGLTDAIARAVAHADLVAPDEYAGLPEDVGGEEADLELTDSRLARRESAEKVEEALQLERLIRAADARVTNSS
ncbi:MAG: TldD/PmbA family protein, partial [Candidatus Eremiobacteraeota bacterium]|nr:TldD/PmbA family protein [Candidatus Eremiobacteraeota bacterium]